MLLQPDHGDLLDTIDRLRSQGISRYIDLPQIVVCGDQSSGKSSVLEAISNIQFPRKDNLCTRFATEVILRRSSEEEITMSIIPAADRSEEERTRLLKFQRSHVRLDEFASLIEEVKNVMGVDHESRAFSNDILRLEVSGPSQPHLTLVDLPGLFQASNKLQSDTDAEAVTSLVLSYMKKRRSIILAVVSAKNDFANQIVTRYARELDPEGHRTLGIITKPDALHAGSDSEKAFFELAENKDVFFRLGWHVLKNRDYDTRNTTSAERDSAEREFFAASIWTSLNPRQVGIDALKPRLSILLKDQILQEVPNLIQDVEKELKDCRKILNRMGTSRVSVQEQRLYLLSISQNVSSLLGSAIEGVYSNQFFESASTTTGYQKRLRAVIQNLLTDFAEQMRHYGHANHIVAHVTKKQRVWNQRLITQEEYIDKVLQLMRRSRGCELPGTYNPQIVRDLFYEQSKPWQALVEEYAEKIWNAAVLTMSLVLRHTADDITAEALQRQVINPSMDEIKTKIDDMISNILRPHQVGHPITYNHYLTENIQKFREERRKKSLIGKIDAFFGTDHSKGKTLCEGRPFDVKALVQSLASDTVADMDRLACSEAIDCMRAFYKVSDRLLPYALILYVPQPTVAIVRLCRL